MAKHAFTVTVFDHGTQKSGTARLTLEANFLGEVDGFFLKGSDDIPTSTDLFRDLKDALGDQLAEAMLEDLDGHEFDGELGGHHCDVTLEAAVPREESDDE